MGIVLKVDGPHAAVYFPETEGESLSTQPTPAMWENSRLFRVDDLLQVVDPSQSSTAAAFLQATPRQLGLPHRAVAVCVHLHTISAILVPGI